MSKILLILFSFPFLTLINITKNVKLHANISDCTRKKSEAVSTKVRNSILYHMLDESNSLFYSRNSLFYSRLAWIQCKNMCSFIYFLLIFSNGNLIHSWAFWTLRYLPVVQKFNSISTQISLIDLDPTGSSTVMQDLPTGAHGVITLSSKNKDKTSNKNIPLRHFTTFLPWCHYH